MTEQGGRMADAVLTALAEQVECYRRLAKLAEVQHEHVQQSATESLLEVLALRQAVLEQIGTLETVVGPARRRWGEYLASLGAEARQRVDQLLGETRALLERITTADRNDAMVLQQRKLNLGRQISQATAARQVNRNYAAAAYGRRASGMDVTR